LRDRYQDALRELVDAKMKGDHDQTASGFNARTGEVRFDTETGPDDRLRASVVERA
jgi:non-homologous end joining protein Ku